MKRITWSTAASLGLAFLPIPIFAQLSSCSSDSGRGFGDEKDYTFTPDAGEDGGGCSGTRCSRDLHQILDGCDGHVVTTCAEGTACGGEGLCVPACDAAAKAQGSLGCDFVALPPDSTNGGAAGSCFAAFVGNTWSEPVNLKLEYDNQEQSLAESVYVPVLEGNKVRYDALNGPLPPGKVAIVFLAQAKQGPPWDPVNNKFIKCPTGTKAVLDVDPIQHGTTLTKSFRIGSDRPVSAYAIWPYGGALSYVSTATMLYPSHSFGSNYVLLDAWGQSMVGMPGFQIVANADDTQVTLNPLVNLPSGSGVTGVGAGATATYTLSRGQTLQFRTSKQVLGSALDSNRPVAVYGGSECMNIPIGGAGACDAAQQQIPPVNQWGREYVGVRYRSRLGEAAEDSESVPWRVIAAADGTELSYDPETPIGAPTTLSRGQSVTFWSSKPFTVRSQDDEHPIFMSAFMTGGSTIITEMGDPEFVNVVPSGQYLDRYVFFADVNYAETSLTFVRQKTDTGFHDVELDCIGTLGGWKPVGSEGKFEFARVDLSRGGVAVTTEGKTCFIGPHESHSDGPFTITVWGWDRYVSYAYPAGVGSRPLNKVGYVIR